MHETKHVPLRLSKPIYEEASQAALRAGKSVNTFIVESVAAKLKQLEDERLYEAFGLLGADHDSAEIETAFTLQKEAIGPCQYWI